MGKPEAEVRGRKTLFLDPSEAWSHVEDFPTRTVVIEEPAIAKELAPKTQKKLVRKIYSP